MSALEHIKLIGSKISSRNIYAFVGQHGREFHVAVRPWHMTMDGEKQCFKNATLRMISENLIYCEGFVFVHGVPIHHAWCLDPEGRVVDPTIPDQERWEYVGIPMQYDFVLEIAMATEMYGVLDNIKNHDVYDMDEIDFVHMDYLKL